MNNCEIWGTAIACCVGVPLIIGSLVASIIVLSNSFKGPCWECIPPASSGCNNCHNSTFDSHLSYAEAEAEHRKLHPNCPGSLQFSVGGEYWDSKPKGYE